MNHHEPIRDARQLGLPKMLILGLQHMFAMFGRYRAGPHPGPGLRAAPFHPDHPVFRRCGHLFFHVCTKLKVPAFLGSSFAYLGGFSAVAQLDSGIYANMTGEEKLPYALGGIVIAGLMYLVLAALIRLLGVRKVMRYLPP